jgi:hypothetical protein
VLSRFAHVAGVHAQLTWDAISVVAEFMVDVLGFRTCGPITWLMSMSTHLLGTPMHDVATLQVLPAPLILSADLRKGRGGLPADVMEILTNKEVISVNQDWLVQPIQPVRRWAEGDGAEVWKKPIHNPAKAAGAAGAAGAGGSLAIVLFHRNSTGMITPPPVPPANVHHSSCTVRVFDRNLHPRMPLSFTPLLRLQLLHACDQCNGIPFGCSLFLPVDIVICVHALKAS